MSMVRHIPDLNTAETHKGFLTSLYDHPTLSNVVSDVMKIIFHELLNQMVLPKSQT